MAQVTDQQKLEKGQDAFTSKPPPTAAYVRWLLAAADTTDPTSPLHRIGINAFDAAAGNHNHQGTNSKLLYDPTTALIPGDLSTLVGVRNAVKAMIRLMVPNGAVDQTTN